jgi:hypothetical protein
MREVVLLTIIFYRNLSSCLKFVTSRRGSPQFFYSRDKDIGRRGLFGVLNGSKTKTQRAVITIIYFEVLLS